MRALRVATLIALVVPVWGEGSSPPACHVPMPEFTLFDLQQRALSLRDVNQPVVVINFIAFWCDTWIGELPQLRELVTREKALGFKLITINVDGAWTSQLAEVCGARPVPWPILIDRRGTLAATLGLRHVPTIFVLDRDRVIRRVFEGYPGNARLLQAIRDVASARR